MAYRHINTINIQNDREDINNDEQIPEPQCEKPISFHYALEPTIKLEKYNNENIPTIDEMYLESLVNMKETRNIVDSINTKISPHINTLINDLNSTASRYNKIGNDLMYIHTKLRSLRQLLVAAGIEIDGEIDLIEEVDRKDREELEKRRQEYKLKQEMIKKEKEKKIKNNNNLNPQDNNTNMDQKDDNNTTDNKDDDINFTTQDNDNIKDQNLANDQHFPDHDNADNSKAAIDITDDLGIKQPIEESVQISELEDVDIDPYSHSINRTDDTSLSPSNKQI